MDLAVRVSLVVLVVISVNIRAHAVEYGKTYWTYGRSVQHLRWTQHYGCHQDYVFRSAVIGFLSLEQLVVTRLKGCCVLLTSTVCL